MVESSFNYGAYSKRGAAGIWQFIRGTGRRFLKINRSVDERLDPLKSSEAAARLFRENYDRLEELAPGRDRLQSRHKRDGASQKTFWRRYGCKLSSSTDPEPLASPARIFYVEFLAAVLVARNYSDYFGPLELAAPRAI